MSYEHTNSSYAVESIVKMIKNGQLILNPKYQRNYVWSDEKASSYIDSLLTGTGSPEITLARKIIYQPEEDVIHNVCDGQQRLKSIYRFVNNEFRLRGTELLGKPWKGKKFDELKKLQQSNLLNESISARIYLNMTDEEEFDNFIRINNKPMTLSRQELRNAYGNGKLGDLLIRSAKNKLFKDLFTFNSAKEKAMAPEEFVLQLFSEFDAMSKDPKITQLIYTGTDHGHLDTYMKANKNISDAECCRKQKVFTEIMSLCKSLFHRTPKHSPFGLYKSIRKEGTHDFNKAVALNAIRSIMNYETTELLEHREAINEAWANFRVELVNNQTYARRHMVKFSDWKDILKNIMANNPESEE